MKKSKRGGKMMPNDDKRAMGGTKKGRKSKRK